MWPVLNAKIMWPAVKCGRFDVTLHTWNFENFIELYSSAFPSMSYFVMYVKRRTWYPGPYVLAGDLGGDLCTSSGNDSLSHTFTFYFRPDNKITKINTNNSLYFAKPAKFLYLFAIIMTNLTIELPGIPRGFPDTCFYSSGKAQKQMTSLQRIPPLIFHRESGEFVQASR